MKKFLSSLVLLLLLLLSLLYISPYNYLLRGISTIYLSGHTTAFLEDYKRFENDTVVATTSHQRIWKITIKTYKPLPIWSSKTTASFMKNTTMVLGWTPKATPFRWLRAWFQP